MKEKRLSQSLEDYLETIYNLEKNGEEVRVKSIAENLGVKMPSVSGALKILSERGLIDYEKNLVLKLTEKGKKIAKNTLEKHQILSCFLHKTLGIDKEIACDKACQIEHILDFDTVTRIKVLNHFIEEFETNHPGQFREKINSKEV